jgi:manganese transport protein
MGTFVNTRLTMAAAVAATVLVVVLNAVLIAQTFGLPVPGIPS